MTPLRNASASMPPFWGGHACRASYLLFALAVAQRLGRAWCIKAGLAPRALLPAACAPILVRAHFKSMAEDYRGLSVAAGSPSHRSFGALPHSPPLRSEERRVGKEGRSRWWPDHLKKK